MTQSLTWLQAAPWNTALYQWLHPAQDAAPAVVHLATLVAHGGMYPLALLLLYGLWQRRAWSVAGMLVLAWLLASGAESLLATWAWQPRPFSVGFGPAWMSHAADNSMPSSHAMLAVLLTCSLAYLRRWISTAIAAAITLALAWARIYLGIHWPVDMLAALVLGLPCFALAAWGVHRLGLQLQRRRVHAGRHPASVSATTDGKSA